jgi:16S rRNA (uracil1498-N3)-methyltransferase
MPRRRFYVPQDHIRNGAATLPSDQAHHLRAVLRLKTGDKVEIFDGEGRGYTGVVELHDAGVQIRDLQEILPQQPAARLILAPALVKAAKFEWMLQKLTELGVSEIAPLHTRFSDIRIPDNKIDSRLERWERIVREAAKQCRRLTAPQVRRPMEFCDFLRLDELSSCTKLMFHEKASESWQPEKNLLHNPIVVCIGPEGGWEGGEAALAEEAGFRIFSLGPWILRTETAALAAVAIIQYQILNMSVPKIVPGSQFPVPG